MGREALYWLLVGVGYGLLVMVSVRVAVTPAGTVVLWLPAGLALAAVLSLGYRIWPAIAAGMLLPPLLDDTVPPEMAWLAPGAVSGALLAGWLVRRWMPAQQWLHNLAESIRFMMLVVLATLPVALLDGVLGHLAGVGRGAVELLQWWVGNAVGMLLFTPFLLAWSAPATTAGRGVEMSLLVLMSVLLGQFVFGDLSPIGSQEFVLLVLFLWAALRLDIRGMTVLSLLVAVIATYQTLGGHGPFAVSSELVTTATLQGFMVIGTVTGLILSTFTQERKAALDAARLAGKVIEYTPDGVMITDPQLRICAVNPAFTATTGYREKDVLGATPQELASGRHDAAFYRNMWQQIAAEGRWQGEIWNRRKNGDIYLEWLSIVAIRDAHGRVMHYAGIFSDIATQEHVRRRLHNLAYYDALTDLPNRELFQDRLHNAVVQARREIRPVAVMFLDVDFFKAVNDTHGHAIGDGLLRAVAQVLQQCVRRSDTVARLGGDEFTIILTHLNDVADTEQVAHNILTAFNRPFRVEALELVVGASIGIALFPHHGQEPDELLRHADAAMYAAKQAGRNNYQLYHAEMALPSMNGESGCGQRRG